jgi:hypothetical protein
MPDKDEAAGSSPARPTTPALSCGNARRWWNEIAAAPVRRHCIAVSERILRSAGPPRSWASELAAWLHLWFECGGGRVAEAAQGRSGRATVRRAGAPALFPPQSLEASALVRPAPIAGREHVGSSRTSRRPLGLPSRPRRPGLVGARGRPGGRIRCRVFEKARPSGPKERIVLTSPGRPPTVGEPGAGSAPWTSRTKRSLVHPVSIHTHVTAPVGEQPGNGLPWPRSTSGPGAPSKR